MLECVVNVSEGRREDRLGVLAAAAGADLLDVHRDGDHHRAVLTLVGTEAPRRVAAAAVAELDLRAHDGVHPRLGVVDVVPFVPLEPATMADAVAARDAFAAWAGGELGVPCFLYGEERSLPRIAELLKVTEASLFAGIAQAVVGNRLSDISHAVQQHAEAAGFSVVTDFVGHGIGRQLHEEPQVPNYGKPGQGPRLQEGMVLAIEPMINMGKSGVRVLDDRWTAVTTDGSLSAHFEHTIAVQASGPPRILTQVPELIGAC